MDGAEQSSAMPGRAEDLADNERGHTGGVHVVAAGRWEGRAVFASGGHDRAVRLWDAATGRPLGPALTGHAGTVVWAVFAGPDRDILVTGDDTGVVLRWQSRAGVPHGEPFARPESRIVGLGMADVDGRSVIGLGTENGTVRILDAVTGAPHAELHVAGGWKMTRADLGVLDGRLVALTIAHDPAVYRPSMATLTLWDVASGRPLYEPGSVPQETEYLGTLATVDGRLVAVRGMDPYHDYGDDDPALDLDDEDDEDEDDDPYQSEYFLVEAQDFWVVDVATRKVLKSYARPGADAYTATVARAGRRFVALVPLAMVEGTVVNVIDAGVGPESDDIDEFQYTGHSSAIWCVAAAEVDGRTVMASGDRDGNLLFWGLDTPDRRPHPQRCLPFRNS